MARMKSEGLDAVIEQMKALDEQMNGELADSMLDAAAAVVVDAWKKSIEKHGHVDTGAMLKSVKAVNKNGADKRRDVFPQGKDKKGVRNAEKAFILHYGTSSISGDHWVDDAEASSADKAVEAMADVLTNNIERND